LQPGAPDRVLHCTADNDRDDARTALLPAADRERLNSVADDAVSIGTRAWWIRERHQARAAAHPGVARLPVPRRSRSRGSGTGIALPRERHRARVAPLLCLVEPRSGGRAARARVLRTAARWP